MTRTTKTLLNVLRISLPIMLTILWLVFIFGNSLQSGTDSGETSGKVHAIVNMIPELLGLGKPISHHFVRKAAHFTEFAVLSFLVCSDLWCIRAVSLKHPLTRSLTVLSISIPIGIICATTDELLQNLSEGRGPSAKDVLIDSSGVLFATIIFAVFFGIIRYYINKKLMNNTIQKSHSFNI